MNFKQNVQVFVNDNTTIVGIRQNLHIFYQALPQMDHYFVSSPCLWTLLPTSHMIIVDQTRGRPEDVSPSLIIEMIWSIPILVLH